MLIVDVDCACGFSGRWHGNVLIHTYDNHTDSEVLEFLRDVANLSRIRHESVCLFMGACLRSPNYAIVTRSDHRWHHTAPHCQPTYRPSVFSHYFFVCRHVGPCIRCTDIAGRHRQAMPSQCRAVWRPLASTPRQIFSDDKLDICPNYSALRNLERSVKWNTSSFLS